MTKERISADIFMENVYVVINKSFFVFYDKKGFLQISSWRVQNNIRFLILSWTVNDYVLNICIALVIIKER